MGIIANAKQYLEKKAVGAADGISKVAALSPKQIEQIEAKRSAYLASKPNPNHQQVRDTIRRQLGSVSIEVYQAYLEQLKKVYLPVASLTDDDALNRIRFFEITKWVSDPTEKNLDKLANVYHVLSEEDCNIALIYNRTQTECGVILAVVNTDPDQDDASLANTFRDRLVAAVNGNFPGAEILSKEGNSYGYGVPTCLQSAIVEAEGFELVKSIAIVSNLASDKSEDFISQSMEKLLDGIATETPEKEYTVVLLAKPMRDQLNVRNRLFELYSSLAPYATWQTSYTYSESDAQSSSATVGVNLGLSAGVHGRFGTGQGGEESEGASAAGGANASANFGVNFSRGSSVTVTLGKNEGITQSFTNYGVKHTLDVLEKQLKRMDESSALGMWEFAAYVVAQSPVVANNVAHTYLALTQGEESFLTRAAVNLWDGEREKDQAKEILKSVQLLQHPVFGLKDSADEAVLLYPTLITPSTSLSGKELAKALNFPRKSVPGFPVIQCASFGRSVLADGKVIENSTDLGCVYHMRKPDKNVRVMLDRDSLTAHTFITGSTGSGKSNTVYKLLYELCFNNDSKAKFLVVEPAKGEYKQVFGSYEGVSVYGTNFRMGPLLKLNPFSFPDEIHVLEHIDRLIEIFNACWPMYAAMPAVLKDAIEASYESCGWSLTYSVCEPKRYPTFATLLEKLPEIMNRSDYSKDTKGDYIGALVTRVKSLTNGINGQIFCADEGLSDEQLFDQNVIVDLSRVGSMETKSLLMGILMIKLQEYRMAKASDTDTGLRHVTVLEEAHNLLRRTSSEQSQDSSNLQGKSVEMLANAIAEMRTYGEGFIIADQAPGLLDMAVIRNTNTKIIMRLPDESDRVLVGKAAGLTDEQIVELSKLDCGVAAVFQNHWLEAVLCKVEEFKKELKKPLAYQVKLDQVRKEGSPVMNAFFEKLLGKPSNKELSSDEVDKIRSWINKLSVDRNTRLVLLDVLEKDTQLPADRKGEMMYRIVNGNDFLKYARTVSDREAGIRWFDQRVMETLQISVLLAEEIRKEVFLFAADRIQTDPQHKELMYYGGVL